MKNKNLKLYHYSDKKIKKIKIEFFGDNNFTKNEKNICNVKRAFFFTDKHIPEYRFLSSQYLYICSVASNKIYNLVNDTLGLIDKSKIKNFDIIDYNKLFYSINRLGYSGITYNLGYNIIVLFRDIIPQEVYKRINGQYIKEVEKRLDKSKIV